MKNKKSPNLDLNNIMPHLIGVWRRWTKLSGPEDCLQTREFRSVVETLKKVVNEGSHFKSFDDPEYMSAYLLYFWVIHYAQGFSILGELPKISQRVLDLSQGPAPLAFAALKQGAKEVITLNKSSLSLSLGAEIAGRYGFTLTCRQGDPLKAADDLEGSFDLIILGHSLEEYLPTTKSNWLEQWQRYITYLLKRLNPGGHLVLIDNSNLTVNSHYLKLRDLIVDNQIPILAPCVYRGATCPALQSKNPCYAQRDFEKPYLIKELQRASEINLNSLKMSYFILCRPEDGLPRLPEKDLFRIISPPSEGHRGKRYYLCGKDGKKTLDSTLEKHPKESKAFEYLRRGELISVSNVRTCANALSIVEGSSIVVEAACGKPVPMI